MIAGPTKFKFVDKCRQLRAKFPRAWQSGKRNRRILLRYEFDWVPDMFTPSIFKI